MKKYLLSKVMLAMSLSAFAVTPFTLKNVEIKGLNQDQQQVVLSLLKLKPGQVINDGEISKIIKKLYSTGNFENIVVDKKNDNLVIDLTLKETIASLNFKGNSLIPTDQIRKTYEENNVKQGSRLNRDILRQLNEEVEKFYRSQGYSQINVATRYQSLDDGTVNVTIYIDEKKKAYLKTLNITGNKSFSQDQILSDSLVRPDQRWYNFYHNSNFNQQGKNSLLNSITYFYKDKGYAKFKVLASHEANTDAEHPENVTFDINIDEGNVYNVKSVSFFTRDQKLDAELAPYNKIKPGVYNQTSVDNTVEAVKQYLSTLGYAKAEVEPVYRFNDSNNTVDVVLAINKGERFTVNQIRFTGNDLTKDEVIRRTLQQQENAVYNVNKVNRDVSTLLRTGFFSDVNFKTSVVKGTTDQLDLTYELKEAPNGSFQVGLGYGDSQGLTFTTKFSQMNFLGTGRTFGINLEKSKGRFSSSVNFTEPYITTTGLSLNASAYYTFVDTEKYTNYNGYDYRQRVYGVTLGTTVPVSEYGTFRANVSYENNKYYNLYPEYYRALYLNSIGQGTDSGKWKIRSKNLTLDFSYNYNTYDRYLFPTKGNDATVGVSLTSFASTDKYYAVNFSLRNYTPITQDGKWIVSSRLSGAHAKALGNNRYLPINALYSVGGFGTLRGIANGAVGPASINCSTSSCSTKNTEAFNVLSVGDPIGGDSYVAGGIDLIFPLFRGEAAKSVRTSLFIDTAAAWSTQWSKYTKGLKDIETTSKYSKVENFGKPNFRVTGGFAVDWQSPLGLLSFAVAKPIKKFAYDDTEVFSINFGTSF